MNEPMTIRPAQGNGGELGRWGGLTFRDDVRPTDVAAVRVIVSSSGFFSPAEIDVAVELVQDRLANGADSSYRFLFANDADRVVGYTCFGLIPCTVSSFDLYWIAVHPQAHGRGIGRELLRRTEVAIVASGGSRVYIETSSRSQYEPTQRFYAACGYREAARLADFYAPGDGKIIYERLL